MFTDEHVAIAIFKVLTHSCFLAVYLKDKKTHLVVTEVDMSDFKNRGVCFKIKLSGEGHMSFPFQKCGVFQPVQTSFQATISPLVICCAACQCMWSSFLQSRCQALTLQLRCDQIPCLGACTKIRKTLCIFFQTLQLLEF